MIHAIGDGLTLMECRHPQFVDAAAQPNGLGPDQRDWRTIPAYRERMERARRDIEKHREHIAWIVLAEQAAVMFSADDVRGLVELTEEVFDDGK